MGLHLLLMSALVTLPLEPILAVSQSLNDASPTKTKTSEADVLQAQGVYAQEETRKLLAIIESKNEDIKSSQKLESAQKLNSLASITAQEEETIADRERKKKEATRAAALAKERAAQQTLEQAQAEKRSSGESFAAHVSAYTAAADETGGTGDGITASGARVQAGHTIACPKSYAFGTKVHFDGYGTFVCEDRGGAIKGNRFDMYMHTKAEAFSFGRRTLTASIVD